MDETTTDTGLRYTDLETGSGETATGAGQTIIVHYTGWLEDGTKFDSSTFQFPAGLRLRHPWLGRGCQGHAGRRRAATRGPAGTGLRRQGRRWRHTTKRHTGV
jgi:hypothetical protein